MFSDHEVVALALVLLGLLAISVQWKLRCSGCRCRLQARDAQRVHHQIGKLLSHLRSNETAYGAILQVAVDFLVHYRASCMRIVYLI